MHPFMLFNSFGCTWLCKKIYIKEIQEKKARVILAWPYLQLGIEFSAIIDQEYSLCQP